MAPTTDAPPIRREAERYLNRHAVYGPLLPGRVHPDTVLSVVIPCHREEGLADTLASLWSCTPPRLPAEVIVVVNGSGADSAETRAINERTAAEAREWIAAQGSGLVSFHVIHVTDLPPRHAGVGLARKVGMDEAVRRLAATTTGEGVIVCLDADCVVDDNYLAEIEGHFLGHPRTTGCSVYFEHPVGDAGTDPALREGIVRYELFLRYYKQALAWCGFPYPYHTVGSSMAVRSGAYARQGGMNRRQAGEDFYFLHKLFPLGPFSELNTTRVIPSPRPSDRVPFGTGRAMRAWLAGDRSGLAAYDFRTFADLRTLFGAVPGLYRDNPSGNLPESVRTYLTEERFPSKLEELRSNSATEAAFVKRFFGWFDGFRVLKFAHFVRDRFYAEIDILEAAGNLAGAAGRGNDRFSNALEALEFFRAWDRRVH